MTNITGNAYLDSLATATTAAASKLLRMFITRLPVRRGFQSRSTLLGSPVGGVAGLSNDAGKL